jgi:hypothetical protein
VERCFFDAETRHAGPQNPSSWRTRGKRGWESSGDKKFLSAAAFGSKDRRSIPRLPASLSAPFADRQPERLIDGGNVSMILLRSVLVVLARRDLIKSYRR